MHYFTFFLSLFPVLQIGLIFGFVVLFMNDMLLTSWLFSSILAFNLFLWLTLVLPTPQRFVPSIGILLLILIPPKKYILKPKLVFFSIFMILNFLVQMQQCAENVNERPQKYDNFAKLQKNRYFTPPINKIITLKNVRA